MLHRKYLVHAAGKQPGSENTTRWVNASDAPDQYLDGQQADASWSAYPWNANYASRQHQARERRFDVDFVVSKTKLL